MVQLKVRKFGNSLGVVLPKEVIQRLQTAEGEHLLLVEAPGGTYSIAPHEIQEEVDEQMRIAELGMVRYRNTLRALAQ